MLQGQGRRGATALAALIVGAFAVLGIAPAASAAPATTAAHPPAGDTYGLLAFSGNGVPGSTVAERTVAYRRLAAIGARAVRIDFPWVGIEPPDGPRGQYRFTAFDRELEAITAAGLQVIGILGYGNPAYSSLGGTLAQTPLAAGLPPFAVGSANAVPPDDPADFARFAQATAAHFAGRVVAWEVWNEENEGWRFWFPHEDPAAYGRLLCATHDAIRHADTTTPVIFGGVFFPGVAGLPGMSGPSFVDAAYGADPSLGRCYDAMAYHPYPYPFTAPELDVPARGSVIAAADAMRAALERHGDGGKPLWITEVGWPTHSRTYGVNETKQAQYTARMAAATFAQGVPVLTWYTYGDEADPTGGANQEAWFGFFRPDGSAKPAAAALDTFARTFAGAKFERDRSAELRLSRGRLLLGGRGFALEYARGAERITALWLASESVAEGQGPLPGGGTLGPGSVTVRLPVSSPEVEVVGMLGERRTVRAADGAVKLTLGPSPIYLVDDPGRSGS
jgi:hypothetical protein